MATVVLASSNSGHLAMFVPRSRALLAPGSDARSHCEEAIRRGERTTAFLDRAKTRLFFGEWLRRGRRTPADGGSGAFGPLADSAPRSMAAAVKARLPWFRRLLDQAGKMILRDPCEQPMRQHRPIDHDRHNRITPPAERDASPVPRTSS